MSTLHWCSDCHEVSEVWKRDKQNKFFCYCINRSCRRYQKPNGSNQNNSLDKIPGSDTMESTQAKVSEQNENTMTFNEAKILIEEARKCGYRGTEWEQGFLARLESMQPVVLRPEDALSVQEFYRRATGGGFRIQRSRYKTQEAEL